MNPAPFDTGRYLAAKRTNRLGETLVLLARTESTQSEARHLLSRGAAHGTVVLAAEQSAGSGRRGRPWLSPPGGLYASVILRSPMSAGEAHWLTIAAALGVCEAARDLGVDAAEIKWPNDLIVGERKFGGVLGELTHDPAGSPCAIIGIGVNLDLDIDAVSTATGTALTSLRAQGVPDGIGLELILARILARLEGALALRGADREPDRLLDRWRELSPSCTGRRVTIEDMTDGGLVGGTTRGIDRDGALTIEDDAGGLRVVRFGGTLRFDPELKGGGDATYH